MSLILEALRKSEAERRRGQSPDLYAELPPPSRRAPTRVLPWQWWVLVAAGTLAIAGWTARGYWNESPAPKNPASESPASESPAPTTAAEAGQAPARVEAGPAAAAVASSPARADADPLAPATLAPIATTRPAMAAAVPAHATAAATVSPAAAKPDPAPAPARPAPPAADTAAVATPSIASVPVPARETIAPVRAPGIELPAQPASPATAPPAPTTAAPVRLSDLSTADRQQLPPLKISMHMWGQGPAQRFAIIDGTRVSEGDRIGAAVVDEISADAVVLGWNGLRVKLPVR